MLRRNDALFRLSQMRAQGQSKYEILLTATTLTYTMTIEAEIVQTCRLLDTYEGASNLFIPIAHVLFLGGVLKIGDRGPTTLPLAPVNLLLTNTHCLSLYEKRCRKPGQTAHSPEKLLSPLYLGHLKGLAENADAFLLVSPSIQHRGRGGNESYFETPPYGHDV